MPIKAVCPECGEVYQLQPEMAGKTMVCKLPQCRARFPVPAAPAATVANWWANQPEVRTPSGATNPTPDPVATPTPVPESNPTPEPTPTPTPDPTPVPTSGDPQVPPPVRKPTSRSSHPGKRTNTSTPAPSTNGSQTPAPTPAPITQTPRPRSRNWATRVILGLVVVVLVALGVVGYWALTVYAQNEERLADHARQTLEGGDYAAAGTEYANLARLFPRSEHHSDYQAMEKLVRLLETLRNTELPPDQGMIALKQFLAQTYRDEVVKKHHPLIGKELEGRLKAFTAKVIPATDASPLGHIDKVREMIDRLAQLKPAGLTPKQTADLQSECQRVVTAVRLWERRKDFDQNLNALVAGEASGAEKLEQFKRLLQTNESFFPDLRKEAAIQELRNKLFRDQLDRIVYRQAPADVAGQPVPETTGNFWVQAQLQRPPANLVVKPAPAEIILALVRGVLYALRSDNGEVAWAERVGIDTTMLPVRVRGDEANSDRILVLSADWGKEALTALDRDGRTLWRHRLEKPCLGRPIVVDKRVFLALADGEIQEIETTRGRLLGTFHLGQRLTWGGVREKGTTRLYFAADDSCVYVLDVGANRRCVGILHTGHPSGSLRAAPVLLKVEHPREPGYPGYLVLTLARDLQETGLSVFRLPVPEPGRAGMELGQIPADGRDFWLLNEDRPENRLQRAWPPETQRPDIRLTGWTWFPPAVDPEKLALLTDEGRLGLIGIRQPGNRDPALFPLLPGHKDGDRYGIRLGEAVAGVSPGQPHGRAQVVRMRGSDLWLLAQGQLRRSRIVWDPRTGPKLDPSWRSLLELGDPVHQTQALADPRFANGARLEVDDPADLDSVEGRAILYTVTQPLDRPSVVVTAIEDETGQILWQTQLGLVAAAEPIRLHPDFGPETLLLMDQAGALHHLPADLAPGAKPWDGRETLLAGTLADNPRWPPRLVALPTGKAAVQAAAPGSGRTLVLRRVLWDTDCKAWVVEAHEVPLPFELAGSPALVADHLILPLADGNLHRLSLQEIAKPTLQPGPSWRDRYLGPDTIGCVVSIGGTRFVCSDGDRGLTVWDWPAAAPVAVVLQPNRQPTFTLGQRLTGTPLFLPAVGDTAARLLVADRAGTLLTLLPRPDGSLERGATRDLGGRPTDGPYIATPPGTPACVCVIVDSSRLFWLDPMKDEPLRWKPCEGRETIVGRPRRHGDRIWVATDVGRLLPLDPATGQLLEKIPALQGSIAPATTPVPVGKNLLLPLSDGTLRLLPPTKKE